MIRCRHSGQSRTRYELDPFFICRDGGRILLLDRTAHRYEREKSFSCSRGFWLWWQSWRSMVHFGHMICQPWGPCFPHGVHGSLHVNQPTDCALIIHGPHKGTKGWWAVALRICTTTIRSTYHVHMRKKTTPDVP